MNPLQIRGANSTEHSILSDLLLLLRELRSLGTLCSPWGLSILGSTMNLGGFPLFF